MIIRSLENLETFCLLHCLLPLWIFQYFNSKLFFLFCLSSLPSCKIELLLFGRWRSRSRREEKRREEKRKKEKQEQRQNSVCVSINTRVLLFSRSLYSFFFQECKKYQWKQSIEILFFFLLFFFFFFLVKVRWNCRKRKEVVVVYTCSEVAANNCCY